MRKSRALMMARVSGTLRRKVVPSPANAAHGDGALEAVHDGLDDVHADAAAADLGDLAGGAEAGVEDEVEGIAFAQALGLLGGDDAAIDGLADHGGQIDAAAVVAGFDDHLVALVIGVEADGSLGRLAGGDAVERRLDAVIDGVAQQVHHGFGQGVQNALVEVGVFAFDDDVDLAAGLLGGVAHHARQAAEHLLHGHHADLHDRALQLVENLRLEEQHVGGFGAQGGVAQAAVHLGQQLLHHALGDDELADQVEDHVDALGLDADDILGGSGRTLVADLGALRRSGRLGAGAGAAADREAPGVGKASCAGESCWRGAKSSWRGRDYVLGAAAACRSGGGIGRLRINAGDHGGDFALALHPFERVMAGKGHFDDVGNRAAVFVGTHHQDGSGLLQNIAHQLHGGGAHGAVGIDGEREVINLLSADRVSGDQQALVFGPVELRGKDVFRVRIEQRLDELEDRIDGGRRKLIAIGGEQIVEQSRRRPGRDRRARLRCGRRSSAVSTSSTAWASSLSSL